MLARASSDAGTRLRRSKSTSTVPRHAPLTIEPLDPEIAQQHAVAAATAAFFRSRPHEPTERKGNRSVELVRSQSTASRKTLTSQGSHFPPRTLSIRSVPPQKNTLSTGTHRNSTSSAPQTDKVPSFDNAPSSNIPTSSSRPLSAQPSIGSNDYGRPSSQPKSHRQSAAFSITSQQIRKARSMYYASSVQTGSPIARPPAKYLTTPPPIHISSGMSTAPAAYVPTRSIEPSPLAMPQVPVAVVSDKTIDNARNRHLQYLQHRPVKHKPSIFLVPFKKRQDRSREKAKRLSSGLMSAPPSEDSFTDGVAGEITVNDFMPPLHAKEKRSISGSLKSRIKRVFRRSSNKAPSLPVQHVDASRDYFTNSLVVSDPYHADIPSPTEAMLRTTRSRNPSIDGASPRIVRSASRSSSRDSVRSNRSLHSETNISHSSSSRVTSWDTSASGETLTQRAIKRLTVIHEAKDSIGSVAERPTSTTTHHKLLPPTFTAFKDPIHMESLAEEAAMPSVDPRRVFSALLREIDGSKSAEPSTNQANRTPGAESDVFESSKTKELHSTAHGIYSTTSMDHSSPAPNKQESLANRPGSEVVRSIPAKKSSIRSFGQTIRCTIRTVTPGEQRHPFRSNVPDSARTDPNGQSPNTSSSDQESRTTRFKDFRLSKKRQVPGAAPKPCIDIEQKHRCAS